MLERFLTLLVMFSVGAIGGIWAQAFLLPALAANPDFQNFQFIQDWSSRTQVVSPVKEIHVTENGAVQNVVQDAKTVVVGVESASGRRGSGLVFTSDGLVVTTSYLVPQGSAVRVYLEGREPVLAQVLKRDAEHNLALLKIEETGLQTKSFVSNGGLAVGARFVLVAQQIVQEGISVFANVGFVTQQEENRFLTQLTGFTTDGAPVFDTEGSVVGLTDSDAQGAITIIPSSILRPFLGL